MDQGAPAWETHGPHAAYTILDSESEQESRRRRISIPLCVFSAYAATLRLNSYLIHRAPAAGDKVELELLHGEAVCHTGELIADPPREGFGTGAGYLRAT